MKNNIKILGVDMKFEEGDTIEAFIGVLGPAIGALVQNALAKWGDARDPVVTASVAKSSEEISVEVSMIDVHELRKEREKRLENAS